MSARAPYDRRWGWGVGALGVLALAVLLQSPSFPGPPCLFHLATGYPCPGCGTTRALRALLRLDVGAAVLLNPLTTMMLVGFLLWAVRRAGEDFGLWQPWPGAARWWAWLSSSGLVWLVGAVALNWAYVIAAGR